MFEFTAFQLMHPHGKELFPMEEKSPHDAAELDPERGWRQDARIFRCASCATEIVVVPAGVDAPGTHHG
jgi:hypothetical protein